MSQLTDTANDPHADPDLQLAHALDDSDRLPARNRSSIATVLGVQALNSFSDNLVKMVLISLAFAVAQGSALGTEMQVYLGLIFQLPYFLFAPLAGYMSDRFSKQRVIFWMQAVQVVIFLGFLLCIHLRDPYWSLVLSLASFFVLAMQAAFFAPAKLGIMKELAGSRRLGMVSGWFQMSMMAAILLGMGLGGMWFGHLLETGGDPWRAAFIPVATVTVFAVCQTIGALFVQRTPEHPQVKFQKKIWWEHFSHLKLVFRDRPIALSALGITFFWFMSNAVGTILIGLCNELHPADAAAASDARSYMAGTLGIGVVGGSLIASLVCRRRIELGLVPLSGLVLAASLMWAWTIPVGSNWIFAAMALTGVAGGGFMVPLYAFVQDRAVPYERARVLAGVGLLDCLGGILGNALVWVFLQAKFPSPLQLGIVGVLSIAAAIYVMRLLPRNLLSIIAAGWTRLVYRLRAVHSERVPMEGSVLILPNHTSYVDALVVGVACDRPLRFVMLEALYQLKSLNWALKIFGTVPISTTKAREAIRTVADALKEKQAVVLFPEGQITRTGFLNEIGKGYELMARLGGESVAQPVWIDGVWGSLFSFERGRVLKKKPKALPYRISAWFGEPVPAREATAERMQETLTSLSAQAFGTRAILKKVPTLTKDGGQALLTDTARIAWINAVRLSDTALVDDRTTLVCLLPDTHPLHPTFASALPALRPQLEVRRVLGDAGDDRRTIVVREAGPAGLETFTGWLITVQAAEAWVAGGDSGNGQTPDGNPGMALFDAASGLLLTLSLPHPVMPEGEEDLQRGHRPGSGGHFLPGLSMRREGKTLEIGGMLPDAADMRVRLAPVMLDAEGFLWRAEPADEATVGTQA